MSNPTEQGEQTEHASENDHLWLVQAEADLDRGLAQRVIDQCKRHLTQQPGDTAVRLLLASALLQGGRHHQAKTEAGSILQTEPDHLIALKLSGDAAFATGDEWAAAAAFQRVLELDPTGRTLTCRLRKQTAERTRTVTLHRSAEPTLPAGPGQSVPIYSETIGDLYLAQGHPRLAAHVFRRLAEEKDDERIRRKLATIEEQLRLPK